MTMRPLHFAGIVSALLLNVALPDTAVAHLYPPHTNCGPLEGTAHLACNKQMGNIERTGVHNPEAAQTGAPAPGNAPAVSASATHRAGTTGANNGTHR